MILGTAGHIDHGKTALVRALTGVDTDRLPEEKRRGITIDLGFAPLLLDDGTVVGVVDVPGHEGFVRTMLAGASGIDLALLVIAADEGPMPQTREHLAILELLAIPRAVVALTKSDLVDNDWLELVTEEVRELLAPTRFSESPIVATSVTRSTGIDQLRAQIAATLPAPSPNPPAPSHQLPATSHFRLPIDRSFSRKGTGTVATGTVWSGELRTEESVRIMPSGNVARVRALHSHGEQREIVGAGTRAAIALAGVDTASVARGTTLITHPAWDTTRVIRADLRTLAGAPDLRPRTRVRFHIATADVGARVIAAGGPVTADSTRPVRIVLDELILARAGDHFVIRSASPLATIGGGTVTDPFASRRSRPMSAVGLDPSARLELLAAEAGIAGLRADTLSLRLGVSDTETDRVISASRSIERVGDRLIATSALDALGGRIISIVKAHHAERPLDTGAPKQDVRSRLDLEAPVFEHIVARLARAKKVEAHAAELRVAGHGPALSQHQQKTVDEMLAVLDAAGNEPPSVSELQQRFGTQTHSLLRHLERQHRVVQVEDTRFYTAGAVRELLQKLAAHMAGNGEFAPAELREVLGFSRKFLIPFLEYCDKRGYTARHDGGRVWRGGNVPMSTTTT